MFSLKVFFLGLSLIVAIGAQNAFILKMGILRSHVFMVFLFCFVSDAILIFLGVLGGNSLIQGDSLLLRVAGVGGACYIIYMGIMMLKEAFHAQALEEIEVKPASLKRTFHALFVVTWFNPHVYLDTVGIFGVTSLKFFDINEKMIFALGGTAGSFLWFGGLAFFSMKLSPYLKNKTFWQLMHLVFSSIMFYVAYSLLDQFFTLGFFEKIAI